MITGTATSFTTVGVNSHWRTAASAASSRSGIDRELWRRRRVPQRRRRLDNHDTLDAGRLRRRRIEGRTSLILVGVLMPLPTRTGPSGGGGGGAAAGKRDTCVRTVDGRALLVQLDCTIAQGVGFGDELLL